MVCRSLFDCLSLVTDYHTLLLAWEVALGTTILIRPYLAKTLLGWQPKKPGLVDGLPVYYAAWKAAQ
jgi:hypothetical protein